MSEPVEEKDYYSRAFAECREAIPEATEPCSACVNYVCRAAVEAETVRCAGVDPSSVACPLCQVRPKVGCESLGLRKVAGFHSLRWRVAIRQKHEGGEGEDD